MIDHEGINNVDQQLINKELESMETLPFNTNDLKPINKNGLSLFEIPHGGEFHVFHIGQTMDYIVVGGMSNSGLMPQFWIEKDDTFTTDETLQAVYELIQESLYNDEELSGLIEF